MSTTTNSTAAAYIAASLSSGLTVANNGISPVLFGSEPAATGSFVRGTAMAGGTLVYIVENGSVYVDGDCYVPTVSGAFEVA